MKILLSAVCALFLGVTVIASPLSDSGGASTRLLGAKQCSWGPTYWCANITNAKGCHAVRHCIQTVWEKQTVPEDKDSICQICLDMVKQARDQLESNETQEDLKAVFEGSCKLIPLKPVQKECMKLADDFIPELVEALASQMNPQVVCSVAGLCNNDAIDQMLTEAASLDSAKTVPKQKLVHIEHHDNKLTCSGCNNVATLISNKFHSANRDDFLENVLHVCGKLSSYSDACSNIVLTYFNEIHDALEKTLSADSVCHMSGVCSAKYHQHEGDIEIRPLSNVGVVPVNDDIPCELCEQLVMHLRDLLIANTTEAEFKNVLDGLCKQTHKFEKECLSIVDQYYGLIYEALVNNLDANGACFMIGICPKGFTGTDDIFPIKPFLPALKPARIEVTIKEKGPVKKQLGANEPKYTQDEIDHMQLPIDVLVGAPNADRLVDNGEMCTLCEYFLHFVQEALATPSNADKIKHVIESTCNRMPKTIEIECHNFVDMYGDAVLALLIQGIDPRETCPKLKMCPAQVKDMEIFSPKPVEVSIQSGDKPSCPLCLLAVQQLQNVIKSDKSKEHIKQVLDKLCTHLPNKLKSECDDFVETYSSELIEMLITDLKAQQICQYLKICTDTYASDEMEISTNGDTADILTNEIHDDTVNGQHISLVDQEYSTTPQCLLCQRIIKKVESEIINKKSKEEIKNALEHVCEKLKKLKNKCQSFVEKHGDEIAELIIQEVAPKEICSIIGLCAVQAIDDLDIDEAIKVTVIAMPAKQVLMPLDHLADLDDISEISQVNDAPPCVICEFVMANLEKELKDKKTQDEIKHTVLNICSKMPKTVAANCQTFVEKYADLVIALIDTVPPKEICTKINLCKPINYEITDEVVECGVCHGAVVFVSEAIQTPGFDAKTDMIIDRGCNSMPGQYYEKCSELLKVYGPSIMNLLNAGTEVSKICPKIGMCFEQEHSGWEFVKISSKARITKRIRRELVGKDKCTWGPAYWCENNENAENCKTTSYCEEKVWSKKSTN